MRGRDIKRYSYSFENLYVIALFPSLNYDIDDYPAVKSYLLSFGKERLEQTGKTYIVNNEKVKSRKKTNNKWFETQDSISYWNDFSRQKIVWGNLCLSAQYAWVDDEYYINAPSPMIIGGSKFLLGILNSKVSDWYIRQLGVTRNGGYFEYKPMFVEQIPIPQVDLNIQNGVESLVNIIIENKSLQKDTSEIEYEIDKIIYKIYNLSNDEIDLIVSLDNK